MGWPRFRFTVGRLMVAVAVLALILGTGVIWRRSRAFALLSDAHALEAGRLAERWLDQATGGTINRDVAGLRGEEDRRRRLKLAEEQDRSASEIRRALDRQLALAEKYRRASRRPWLTVEPDPAGPE